MTTVIFDIFMIVLQFLGFISLMFAFVSDSRWFQDRETGNSDRAMLVAFNRCACFCKLGHTVVVQIARGSSSTSLDTDIRLRKTQA